MIIKGKTAIVTGGLGSLGSSVVEFLKSQGSRVVVFDRVKSETNDYYCVNLNDEEQINSTLDKIDKVDILVNCAGEIYSEPVINIMRNEVHSEETWHRIIGNNLDSCFLMSSRVAAKMAKNRIHGVIINFSSISAEGNMGQAAYSAAKAGIEALTKVMAKELGMFKIRVCAIAPGFIDTPSTHDALSDSLQDQWKKRTPLRVFGTIDDINKTIEYVITTDYISGAIIHIDGGLTI